MQIHFQLNKTALRTLWLPPPEGGPHPQVLVPAGCQLTRSPCSPQLVSAEASGPGPGCLESTGTMWEQALGYPGLGWLEGDVEWECPTARFPCEALV